MERSRQESHSLFGVGYGSINFLSHGAKFILMIFDTLSLFLVRNNAVLNQRRIKPHCFFKKLMYICGITT